MINDMNLDWALSSSKQEERSYKIMEDKLPWRGKYNVKSHNLEPTRKHLYFYPQLIATKIQLFGNNIIKWLKQWEALKH